MNLIIEHLKARRPGLAQNTYTTYARSILRLRKVSADLVPKEIDKYLETLPVTTARNLLTALIVFDERIARLDAWSKRHERYDALAAAHRDQQSMSDYESAHWVSWKKVLGAVKRMREDVTNQKLFERGTTKADHRLLSGYIAMSIHSKFQWRNDVPSIRVVETSTLATNKKHNYFVLSVGKFIFHDFKTAKFFKRRKQWPLVLEVPPSLRKLLHNFCKKHKRQWLLPQLSGKQTSKASYKGLLQWITYRYLGVKLGTTMLRKIYLSEFLRSDPRLTERKKTLTRMMQLSLEQQFQYRRR